MRVSISPSTKSGETLFITLSEPVVEEYVIKNKTDFEIKVYKYLKGKSKSSSEVEAVVKPKSDSVIVWDEPHISPKCIAIK